ncbi:hypothetical protein F4604DRAFT_1931304 [Suillus subluteus]|nr:hypothetical protein F4604DRAFT_1931304 [Suillus subluteus]
MDLTRANTDTHTTWATPPPSDSDTTTSTCVNLVLSSSFQLPDSKIMSPLSPSRSLTSSFTFEPEFVPLQRDDKCKPPKRKNLRRKHTLRRPSTRSQDRIKCFCENMHTQFPQRLLYHAVHPELKFVKKHIEHSSHKEFTQEDLYEGMELLQNGLSRLSDRTFRKAALFKHAAQQGLKHAIIYTSWKLEMSSRERDFLQSLQEEQEEDFKLAESEMAVYRQIVCARGLPSLQDEKDYLQAVFAENLDDFDIVNEQCRQFVAHGKKCAIATPFASSSDTEQLPDELLEESCSDSGLSDDSLIYDA